MIKTITRHKRESIVVKEGIGHCEYFRKMVKKWSGKKHWGQSI